MRDKNGIVPGVTATYEAGRLFTVVITHDVTPGSYSLSLDGVQVVTDRVHGVTERGIGGIYVGCNNDSNYDGKLYLDMLQVDADAVTPTLESSWSAVKQQYR